MKLVYLDHAATTPVDKTVLQIMKPYFSVKIGNPSEPHLLGQQARKAVESAREIVANFLGAAPGEIIFTSGATESINLSHKGFIEYISRDWKGSKRPHIITSRIEHKAVLESCAHLEKLGWTEVTYLPVDQHGLVKVEDIEKAIRPETILVSVMYVNNEVGTVQPIPEIGHLLKTLNHKRLTINHQPIYFHTDATQGIQYLDCHTDYLGVDLLSLTGHKFYAPKGIGVLYIKNGTPLIRQQDGGGQESKLRSGTENVPYIVGLGKALELVTKHQVEQIVNMTSLRDQLIEGVLKIPDTRLTGHPTKRAPHIASFTVEGVEGEALLLLLSEKGISVSTGSACNSNLLSPSHVLSAMGISPEKAHGSIRFSLGKDNTKADIDYLLKALSEIVRKLRKMAPKLKMEVAYA